MFDLSALFRSVAGVEVHDSHTKQRTTCAYSDPPASPQLLRFVLLCLVFPKWKGPISKKQKTAKKTHKSNQINTHSHHVIARVGGGFTACLVCLYSRFDS